MIIRTITLLSLLFHPHKKHMQITKNKEVFPEYENIEVREPLVSDVIEAQRVAGTASGRAYEAALIAQVATFDGKTLVMEDVKKIPERFFFEIYDAVMNGELTKLVDLFLSSQNTQDSDQKPS